MIAYILNLADLLFTLYAVNIGVQELNPFMQNVPVMVFYKTVIVGVLLWWLTKRRERLAKMAVQFCTAVYAVLCFYHLFFIGGAFT